MKIKSIFICIFFISLVFLILNFVVHKRNAEHLRDKNSLLNPQNFENRFEKKHDTHHHLPRPIEKEKKKKVSKVLKNDGDGDGDDSIIYEKKNDDVKSENERDLQFLSKYETSILILVYDRFETLEKVVKKLINLKGVKSIKNFIISQDGNVKGMYDKIEQLKDLIPDEVNFLHFHNSKEKRSSSVVENISNHYKFALDKAFQISDFVIILEDDCLPSNDLLTFFDQLGRFLIDKKENVFCISSWNDFGFEHFYMQKDKVFRTQFFPGLGWMTHKDIWNEISNNGFAPPGWDYFMRTSHVFKGRDCICPELSRTKNIGDKGATVKQGRFDVLLKNIGFYSGDEGYVPLDLENISVNDYEQYIQNLVDNAVIMKRNKLWDKKVDDGLYLIPYDYKMLRKVLESLKITYHGAHRTHHNRLQKLQINEKTTVLLVDVRLSKYIPENLRVYPDKGFQIVPANSRNVNCNKVCSSKGKKCSRDHFDFIMSCNRLKEHFACERGCTVEVGNEIPVYVSSDRNRNYKLCVIAFSNDNSRCDTKHIDTQRLCPCV